MEAAMGEFEVHYRLKGQPVGQTNKRICETGDAALDVAKDLLSKGGYIAFISRGTDRWLTAERVTVKLKKK